MGKSEELVSQIPESMHMGPFLIQMAEIRNNISHRYLTIEKTEMEMLCNLFREKAQDVNGTFMSISNQLKKTVTNIEELTELREFMDTIPAEILKQQIEIKRMNTIY